MKSLFIDTYKWHDKTYGNSYFASVVSIDGLVAFSLPFQYGYERQDEEMMRQELVKAGYLANSGESMRRQLEAMGCHYYRATQWVTKAEAKRQGELMPFMIGQAH